MYTEKEQTTSTEAIVAAAASLAGAAVGIIAGPAGVVAGAVIGSLAGAAAGAMLADSNHRRWHHDEELDTVIGVYHRGGAAEQMMTGSMGAAPPDAPPARIGAFSSGSAGGAGARPSTPPPNEGPMQEVGG